MQDLEATMLQKRKELLQKAIKSGQFKHTALVEARKLNESNLNEITKSVTELRKLVSEFISKSFTKGYNNAKTVISEYKEQQPTLELNEVQRAEIDSTEQAKTNDITILLINVLAMMSSSVVSQYNQVVNMVDDTVEDLASEIDKLQLGFLKKGLTGKVLVNGNEKNAFAETEFILRDGEHKSYLTSYGETTEKAGLNPLIQVTAHPSSCKSCFPYQNRILVDDVYQGGKADGKHELLSEAIENGFLHYNCRCTWVSYIQGADKPTLFERETQTAKENALNYAYEQRQREIERNIRAYKSIEDGALTEEQRLTAQQKIREWQEAQRKLIKLGDQKGLVLTRQYSREQLGGHTTPQKRS